MISRGMVIRRASGVVIASLSILIAGCSGGNLDDLQAYAAEVRARKGGRVEPLPKIENYEPFAYAATDLRDPFIPAAGSERMQQPQTGAGGLQPDFNRRREQTEDFPLDALQLVGIVVKSGTTWAILRHTDGTVFRVRTGNYVGQNHGKITKIGETKLEITEIVPDGLGGWRLREAAIAMRE